MNSDKQIEIWKHLFLGMPLDNLGLGEKDGRLNLCGLIAPEPSIIEEIRTKFADVSKLGGVPIIKHAKLHNLDFTGSILSEVLFFDCNITNCIFDSCKCQNWGLWGTAIVNTSFQSADLRNSALGGIQENKINSYQGVDFSRADFRGVGFTAAAFTKCRFKNTKLDKVDFQTSAFTDCIFEGELREVLFYRRGFKGESFPPNEMLRVDFSHAKLRWCQFRGLDLDNIVFPADQDHIVLDSYPQTLSRLISIFEKRTDMASRQLTAIFRLEQKWLGAKQRRGVLNKKDLQEMCGPEGLQELIKIIEEVPPS